MPYKWAILFEMLWLLVTIGDTTGYTIPQPKASALRPRGFRISIPGEFSEKIAQHDLIPLFCVYLFDR